MKAMKLTKAALHRLVDSLPEGEDWDWFSTLRAQVCEWEKFTDKVRQIRNGLVEYQTALANLRERCPHPEFLPCEDDPACMECTVCGIYMDPKEVFEVKELP